MPIDFRDEVRNTVTGVVGTVDAIYSIYGISYIDVIIEDKMEYKSPVSNWELINKCDE